MSKPTFTVSKDSLESAIRIVSRAVSPKSTLPVLEFIRFDMPDNETLRLSATDLTKSITVKIPAKINQMLGVCLPAKTIVEFIGTLSSGELEMTIDERTMVAKIVSGSSKSSIKGITTVEFPNVSPFKGQTINLSDSFWALVSRVAVAASGDEARPILTGIFIKGEDKTLTVSAADGFRLARAHVLTDSDEKYSVIIPASAIRELVKVIKGDCKMTISTNAVLFESENVSFASQLIDGNYPDVDQIIPESFPVCVTVASNELKTAVRRAMIFSREEKSYASLLVSSSNNMLTVKGQAEETGETLSDIEATVTGDDVKASFNVKYLSEGVDVFGAGDIKIQLESDTSPGMFSRDDDPVIYLMMPMNVD